MQQQIDKKNNNNMIAIIILGIVVIVVFVIILSKKKDAFTEDIPYRYSVMLGEREIPVTAWGYGLPYNENNKIISIIEDQGIYKIKFTGIDSNFRVIYSNECEKYNTIDNTGFVTFDNKLDIRSIAHCPISKPQEEPMDVHNEQHVKYRKGIPHEYTKPIGDKTIPVIAWGYEYPYGPNEIISISVNEYQLIKLYKMHFKGTKSKFKIIYTDGTAQEIIQKSPSNTFKFFVSAPESDIELIVHWPNY